MFLSQFLIIISSLRQVLGILQCLWIFVNFAEVFPVIIFDYGVILVVICVHDKLHAEDLLLVIGNASCSFSRSDTSALMFFSPFIVYLLQHAWLWSG